jgi:hypothetical protein
MYKLQQIASGMQGKAVDKRTIFGLYSSGFGAIIHKNLNTEGVYK